MRIQMKKKKKNQLIAVIRNANAVFDSTEAIWLALQCVASQDLVLFGLAKL